MSNDLLFFSDELQKLVSPKVPEDVVAVQRGLLLYRQNMVYRKTSEPEQIKATVQDVVPCHVTLNLSFPTNSSCTCKSGSFCRHQLAVFFSSYSALHSISEWIQNWKDQSAMAKHTQTLLQVKRAKDILLEETKIEKTYESWKTFMENAFIKNFGYFLNQPSYVLSTKWDAYMHRIKSKTPLEAEWRLLYLFIVYFQSYIFLLRTLQKPDISQSTRYFLEEESEELIENMYYMLEHLNRSSRPFAFDDFFKGIKGDLDILLQDKGDSAVISINAYRAIWSDLLKEKTWRLEELAFLENKLQNDDLPQKDDEECNTILLAAIHLALLCGKNQQVPELIQKIRPQEFPFLSYWIRHLEEQKSGIFIEYIVKNIGHYFAFLNNFYRSKEFVSYLTPYVKNYCTKTQKMDLFEKYCEICLPHSFMSYSRFLLETDKHKKWVELYLYNNLDYKYISNDDIKIVQNSNPTLLLPLLTHIVNENIATKNRQSYREAVRYLKKIRAIYKKEKKLTEWDRYIELIQSSHKRLRAFQEELKRGKLIHVE